MRTHFEYVLTPEQYSDAVRRNNQRLLSKMPERWLIHLAAISLISAVSFMFFNATTLMEGQHAVIAKPLWVAAIVAFLAYIVYAASYSRGLHRSLLKSTHHANISTTLSIEEAGFRVVNTLGESFTPWSAVESVEEVNECILVRLDNIHFVPMPSSVFLSSQEKSDFLVYVKEMTKSGLGEASQPSVVASTQTISDQGVEAVTAVVTGTLTRSASVFRTSAAQAFKMAILMRVPEAKIHVTWWQIPVFALLALLVSLVGSLLRVGWAGEFLWYSLPMALFHLPVMMLAAIFVAYATEQSKKTLLLVQVFLMITLALDLTMLAVSSVLKQPPPIFYARAFGFTLISVPSLWLAIACYVAAIRITFPKLTLKTVVMGICIVFIALPLGASYRQSNIWDIPYDENQGAEKRASGLESEDNFYAQPKVLERELAAVQPERKGVTDVFFIGMAGYGGQDVFMKEVDAVSRLFRERFDAEGHTIRLVNNNKTLTGSPVASATSLKAALQRVAQVMDKDEDILFLFLTSHGSEKHHFSLELWPLKFNQLDPTQLRKMLDESGIKNRVVVVSACYSGGFINALKDENTLVISASAPDKNSFGCGNENDWTYFGNAYFNEALRNTYSFTEAFNLAKPAITAREKKEKFEASNPQMALGEAIRSKLTVLEQHLAMKLKSKEVAPASLELTRSSDKIVQYVNLVYDKQVIEQDLKACLANMQSNGPETFLEINPNYFNGLNKSSEQWPKLVSAWNKYTETYCEQSNDVEMLRSLYTKHLRANMSEKELVPVLRFLTSDIGNRWYPLERNASRDFSAELSRIQREISAVQSNIYQAELARIFDESAAKSKAPAKKP